MSLDSEYPELSAAACDVIRERERQITEENFTEEHDDEHVGGQLISAGIAYSTNALIHAQCLHIGVDGDFLAHKSSTRPAPATWPWAPEEWKPTTPRHDLVKAAALILAEIERLDRAAERSK